MTATRNFCFNGNKLWAIGMWIFVRS